MLIQCTIEDIDKILEIEREMYWNSSAYENLWKEKKGEIKKMFESCIKNFKEGCWISDRGFIIVEKVDRMEPIPYIHNSEDYHKPDGKFFYISGFGIKNKDAIAGSELYKWVIEGLARKNNIEKIIVIVHHGEAHDILERELLKKFRFIMEKIYVDWKLWEGKIDKADVWIRKIL